MPNEFLDLTGLQKFKENISAVATQNKDGFMSSEDKILLDGIVESTIGENLIPYPFSYSLPSTNRGITFNDYDGEGGISANGTLDGTGQPFFVCEADRVLLKANQPYTFASNCTNEYGFVIMWFRKPDGSGGSVTMPYTEIRNGVTSSANANYISELRGGILYDGVTIIPSQDVCVQLDVRFDTPAGTVTDAIFYPMLEKGTIAHPYQPHNFSRQKLRDDIDSVGSGGSNVSVTQSLTSGTKVGTITVDGTATDLYAPAKTTVDSALSTTSTNPVQNKVVNTALNSKLTHTNITTATDFDTYKTTGIYHIKASNSTNAPVNKHGTLLVDFDIGTPYQIFIPDNLSDCDYKRNYSSDAWTGWTQRKFTDHTYSNMTAATSSAAGTAGLVPAPAAGAQAKFLRGDGTWQTPTNTDTKVTQTLKSDNLEYPLLLAPSGQTATATTTSCFDSGVTLNPSTNTIAANISGTASQVQGTAVNPTTETWYNPTFCNAGQTTGSKTLYGNGGYSLGFNVGTTTTEGRMALVLGNSTASGTDGNQRGCLRLYDKNSYYANVYFGDGNTTASRNIYFPDGNGTLALNTTATTSANGLMSSADKTKLGVTNIAYATCSTAADTVAKVITIDGNANWTLQKGAIVTVKYTNTNTATGCTLNVNNTGAKKVWYNNAEYTGNSNQVFGYANRHISYMYDGTYWVWMGHGIDNNSTYTNAALGQGYGTCSTAAATTAKVVTLSSYGLVVGGIVSVKFTYAVPANATMNINSKGAKNIFYRGAKITASVIKAGDIATFIYDGTQYHLISVDRGINNMLTTGDVVDNVTSTSTTLPLSANQGKGLNDRISKLQPHPYSLIRSLDIGPVSTTQTTYTTFNNRKISDYGMILITMGGSEDDIRASLTVSRTQFDNTTTPIKTMYLDCWSANGTAFHQIAVKWVSDTQIMIYATTASTATKYVNISGIKVDDVAI